MGKTGKLLVAASVSIFAYIAIAESGKNSEKYASEVAGNIVPIRSVEKYPSAKRAAESGIMMYSDDEFRDIPFAKDPSVIRFKGRYLMYYTSFVPDGKGSAHMGIGLAQSSDLLNWRKVSYLSDIGVGAAPCAVVIDGKIHLFYQSCGRKSSIFHAVSDDGISFTPDPTNPIFKPDGDWNMGRAIDAEVVEFKGKWYLYFASRTPDFKIQLQGVACTPDSKPDFSKGRWKHLSKNASILKPELDWERTCIEAASTIVVGGKLYMFYAGAFNVSPQRIGVAVSDDGVNFRRISKSPFMSEGKDGLWNAGESGHPCVFTDVGDNNIYLFYQGTPVKFNSRKTPWFLSMLKIDWTDNGPVLQKIKK